MTEQNPSTVFMLTPKGEAQLVTTDGQNVTLHAPFPSPPGSPLQGTLKGTTHDVRVKVHGCKAVVAEAATKCFEITGRWVNLSKEAREFLTQP
jgi:hypothetical protein